MKNPLGEPLEVEVRGGLPEKVDWDKIGKGLFIGLLIILTIWRMSV